MKNPVWQAILLLGVLLLAGCGKANSDNLADKGPWLLGIRSGDDFSGERGFMVTAGRERIPLPDCSAIDGADPVLSPKGTSAALAACTNENGNPYLQVMVAGTQHRIDIDAQIIAWRSETSLIALDEGPTGKGENLIEVDFSKDRPEVRKILRTGRLVAMDISASGNQLVGLRGDWDPTGGIPHRADTATRDIRIIDLVDNSIQNFRAITPVTAVYWSPDSTQIILEKTGTFRSQHGWGNGAWIRIDATTGKVVSSLPRLRDSIDNVGLVQDCTALGVLGSGILAYCRWSKSVQIIDERGHARQLLEVPGESVDGRSASAAEILFAEKYSLTQ